MAKRPQRQKRAAPTPPAKPAEPAPAVTATAVAEEASAVIAPVVGDQAPALAAADAPVEAAHSVEDAPAIPQEAEPLPPSGEADAAVDPDARRKHPVIGAVMHDGFPYGPDSVELPAFTAAQFDRLKHCGQVSGEWIDGDPVEPVQ